MIEVLALAGAVTKIAGAVSSAVKAGSDPLISSSSTSSSSS